MMRHGYFAWFGDGAPANETGVRDRMVGRAKGSCGDERLIRGERTRHAVDAGGFQRFLWSEGRQDAWKSLGQHGFTGPRWSDQQDVVSAGRGDFQGAFGVRLSANVGEILRGAGRVKILLRIHADREQGFVALKKFHHLGERVYAVDFDVIHDRGFAGVFFRKDEGTLVLTQQPNG